MSAIPESFLELRKIVPRLEKYATFRSLGSPLFVPIRFVLWALNTKDLSATKQPAPIHVVGWAIENTGGDAKHMLNSVASERWSRNRSVIHWRRGSR